jgi:hypothetical protein
MDLIALMVVNLMMHLKSNYELPLLNNICQQKKVNKIGILKQIITVIQQLDHHFQAIRLTIHNLLVVVIQVQVMHLGTLLQAIGHRLMAILRMAIHPLDTHRTRPIQLRMVSIYHLRLDIMVIHHLAHLITCTLVILIHHQLMMSRDILVDFLIPILLKKNPMIIPEELLKYLSLQRFPNLVVGIQLTAQRDLG